MNGGLQAPAPVGELIATAADLRLLDDPVLGHLSESLGEEIRRDPRQPSLQFTVAGWTEQQVPDNQQGPSLSHQVERLSESAVLSVRFQRAIKK